MKIKFSMNISLAFTIESLHYFPESVDLLNGINKSRLQYRV